MRIRSAGSVVAALVIAAFLVPTAASAEEPLAATDHQRVVVGFDGSTETIDLEFSTESASTSLVIATPAKPKLSAGDVGLFRSLDQLIAPVQEVEDDWWGRQQVPVSDVREAPVTPVSTDAATVISARDSKALSGWLKSNELELDEDAATTVSAYARDGWSLTLITLDAAATYAPLHMEFATDSAVFPIRLTAAGESAVTFRMFVFGEGRTEVRESPRTRSELDAAKSVIWAGPVSAPSLADRGDYLTVTDLRIDSPAAQATTDIGFVAARSDDSLIPRVTVYRPILLLGFPLGWLIVVWAGVGAIVGAGYLVNRFRPK